MISPLKVVSFAAAKPGASTDLQRYSVLALKEARIKMREGKKKLEMRLNTWFAGK